MKKWFLYWGLSLFLYACAGTPRLAEQPEISGQFNGMYSVSGLEQFERVYVRSSEVFAGYNRLLYAPLSLANLEIDDARLESFESWTLQDGDEQNAQRHFAEQLAQVYARSRNYELVEQAGDNTLKVAMALVKYRPNSPRDTTRDRATGTQYFAEGAGRLYMQVSITDAQTGELLAVIHDNRELGTSWQESNRSNNLRRFKIGLNTWIVRIDNGLAELSQL